MVRAFDSSKMSVWQERLRRFACGESSAVEFCRQEGVSAASFYLWRKRLGKVGSPAEAAARQSFLPVRVTRAAAERIIIRLPNGVCIRLPGDNLEALKASIEVASAQPVAAGKEMPRC
jgi:transposase-like protein